MKRSAHPDLAALKKNVELVAVAEARGLKLTRQGKDYVGLCPFHDEKEPSFHVTPAKNLFHCFGCGAAGSVIDFVMRKDGLTFRQAVDKLLTETGVVQRAAHAPPPPEPTITVAPERARVLLERVVAIYEKNFADQPKAALICSNAASRTPACGPSIGLASATVACRNSYPMTGRC